jgi:hypothetical protein
MCLEEFDLSDITFEQRLVQDDSFCKKCWTGIMNEGYDSDLEFNLMEITQKRREG